MYLGMGVMVQYNWGKKATKTHMYKPTFFPINFLQTLTDSKTKNH